VKVLWQGENYRLVRSVHANIFVETRQAPNSQRWLRLSLEDNWETAEFLRELGWWFEQQGAAK